MNKILIHSAYSDGFMMDIWSVGVNSANAGQNSPTHV